MVSKIWRVVFNAVRFIGNNSMRNLLCVDTSAKIEKTKGATLKIEKNFRTRRNVEINVRDKAEVVIGNNVFFNSGCIVTARRSVKIGDNTIFGPNVMVFDNDHAVADGKICDNKFVCDDIVIGNNVWVGAGSIILKGTEIQDNCIIAAGSVVKGKVESGKIYVQKRHKSLIEITEE